MSSIPESLKNMVVTEETEDDQNYLNSFRENSGSGLVNTRISDRENEVCYHCILF